MRAYIQAFCGEPWNEECLSAMRGFKLLGIECVLFNNTDELNTSTREDVVVGGLLMLSHQLNRFNITLPDYNYPNELDFCFGRDIWKEKLGDLRNGIFRTPRVKGFPVFIKPLEEKICKGEVIDSPNDMADYASLPDETIILCSEPVKFVSEWRCYVRYGRILGICPYNGNYSIEYDYNIILQAVAAFRKAPASYAADFGVTEDGKTLLVEVNDGYAIGNYHLDDFWYAQFLSARWCEIFGTTDVIKDSVDYKQWALDGMRESCFWRDDMSATEYEIENKYYYENYDRVVKGTYKPIWKQEIYRRKYGISLYGGEYTEFFYTDKNGNVIDATEADRCLVRKCDEKDRFIGGYEVFFKNNELIRLTVVDTFETEKHTIFDASHYPFKWFGKPGDIIFDEEGHRYKIINREDFRPCFTPVEYIDDALYTYEALDGGKITRGMKLKIPDYNEDNRMFDPDDYR